MKKVLNISKMTCSEWGIFISDFLQGNIAKENSNVIFDFEEDYVVYDGVRFDRSSLDYFNEQNESGEYTLIAKIGNSVFYTVGTKNVVLYNIFNNRVKNVVASIPSVFVTESFEDWIDDMHNTDWDYYGSDPDAWIVDLMSMTNAEILKALKLYAEDNEADAYAKGFLPNNEGVDVREWSSSLYDYFMKDKIVENKKDLLSKVLEDGFGETGGVSYEGETLEDFLQETDSMHLLKENDFLTKVNKLLIKSGIKPIKKEEKLKSFLKK